MSTDETLIRVLLKGYVTQDKMRLPRNAYLEPDSKEELAARAALARRLRNGPPLPKDLSELLADCFDPDPDVTPGNERRIAFVQRFRGRRPQPMANTQIARYVWDRFRSGWRPERAVEQAMCAYGLTREQVYNIWSRYRPIFESTREPFDPVNPNR